MKRWLLVLLLTVPAFGQYYTDNFSGSGAVTTPPWTSTGYAVIGVRDGSGNVWGNGSDMAMYYSGGTFTNNNLYSQVKIVATSSNTFGPILWTPGTGGTVWLLNANQLYDMNSTGGGIGGLGSCPAWSVGDTVRLALTGGQYYCINETTGQSNHYPPLNYTTQSFPGIQADNPAKFALFQAGLANTSISVNPALVITGSTANSITITGTGTSWTAGTPGTPTFTVSGVSCAITSQSVASTTSATIFLNAGGTQGSCILSDPSTLNTAVITIHTPQTWYIRTTGGTAAQCTGHSSAAYPGFGTNQPCALIHQAYLLQTGSVRAWRPDFGGGDTVQYLDAGPYYFGQHNSTSGLGIDMNAAGFTWCASNFDCTFPAFPSGSASQPTQILGYCDPNCANTTDGLKTDIEGINGIYQMFSFEGSNHVIFRGFNIQQPTQCVINDSGSPPTGTCVATNDYAKFAIQFADNSHGNTGGSNLTIQYNSIHGIAQEAFHGSSWNQADPSGTVTIDHNQIRGIGYTGLDPDNGNCHSVPTSCEAQGTINITNNLFAFVGCVTPHNPSYHTNGLPTSCNYGYSQTTGGQGDCLVLVAMATATVNVIGNQVYYCTQDAYDLLHMGDDQTNPQTLNLYNNWAQGMMGQTYKIGGGAVTTAYNNYGNGNCRTMQPAYSGTNTDFSGFPVGWNSGLTNDGCRAGDNLALFVSNGRTTTFVHNTIVGYAPTTFDVQCSATCSGTDLMIFKDNIVMGFTDPLGGALPSGISFIGVSNPFANAGSNISYNQWYHMVSATCPQVVPQETNYLCTDPQFVSEANVDAVNPLITSASPGYHSGVTAGLTTDYFGNLWALPSPSRGFAEVSTATSLINFTLKGQVKVQ